MKICLTFSSGGHGEQAKQLLPYVSRFNNFFVVKASPINKGIDYTGPVYYLPVFEKRVNRSKLPLLLWPTLIIFNILYLVYAIVIYARERPDVIISTGSGSTLALCMVGRVCGSKVIWIESFARRRSVSRAGRIGYYFSSRFFVQWPELKDKYPKAVYVGTIY